MNPVGPRLSINPLPRADGASKDPETTGASSALSFTSKYSGTQARNQDQPVDFAKRIDSIAIEYLRETGATKWAAEGDVIGAFVAEMDFGIAPEIKDALHRAVDDGSFGYLPRGLSTELKEATAEMFAERHDWPLAPEDVHPVPDVIKALQLALEHHSKPGSKIIVPTPAYMPFLSVPPMSGREVIEVPMILADGRYSLDLAGIQKAFEEGGNLLIVCNPCNPVGRVFTRDELMAVCEVVERNEGRVFSDEIWAPLIYGGSRHISYASVSEAAANHTITAISASKAWNLPGLKCAQVVTSNDHDREIWRRIGFFAAHGVSNLGVTANIAAYRSGYAWLDQVVAYLDRNRMALGEIIADQLPGVRYKEPQGTYIGWLDFRDTPLRNGPAEFLREKAGIHLTDGVSCGAGFDGFTRFIFATPLPIMETAFSRISEAMRTL